MPKTGRPATPAVQWIKTKPEINSSDKTELRNLASSIFPHSKMAPAKTSLVLPRLRGS